MRALLLGLAALVATACYETPRPECTFQCGEEGACPEGYSCNEDGWCLLDTAPDATDCGADLTDDDDGDVDAGADAGEATADAEP